VEKTGNVLRKKECMGNAEEGETVIRPKGLKTRKKQVPPKDDQVHPKKSVTEMVQSR
jgi:hypothetical protein